MTLGTKQQYAARGILQEDGSFKTVNKAYISKADIKQLLEPAMEVDPADNKLKINFEIADQLLLASTDASRVRKIKSEKDKAETGDDPSKPRKVDIQTQRELVKLEHEQINLMERKKQTLERQAVTDAAAAAGQKLQEALKACAKGLAEQCATMSDSRTIQILMEAEFRKLLEKMSHELSDKFSGSDDSPPLAH